MDSTYGENTLEVSCASSDFDLCMADVTNLQESVSRCDDSPYINDSRKLNQTEFIGIDPFDMELKLNEDNQRSHNCSIDFSKLIASSFQNEANNCSNVNVAQSKSEYSSIDRLSRLDEHLDEGIQSMPYEDANVKESDDSCSEGDSGLEDAEGMKNSKTSGVDCSSEVNNPKPLVEPNSLLDQTSATNSSSEVTNHTNSQTISANSNEITSSSESSVVQSTPIHSSKNVQMNTPSTACISNITDSSGEIHISDVSNGQLGGHSNENQWSQDSGAICLENTSIDEGVRELLSHMKKLLEALREEIKCQEKEQEDNFEHISNQVDTITAEIMGIIHKSKCLDDELEKNEHELISNDWKVKPKNSYKIINSKLQFLTLNVSKFFRKFNNIDLDTILHNSSELVKLKENDKKISDGLHEPNDRIKQLSEENNIDNDKKNLIVALLEKEQECKKHMKTILDLEESFAKLTESVSVENIKNQKLTEDYSILNANFDSIKHTLEEKDRICEEHVLSLNDVKRSLDLLTEEVNNLNISKRTLELENMSSKEDFSKLQENNNALLNQLDILSNEHANKMEILFNEKNCLESENEKLIEQIDEIENIIAKYKEDSYKNGTNYEKLKTDYSVLHKEFIEAKQEHKQIIIDNAIMKNSLLEKETSEKYFLDNLRQLFSIDGPLVGYQPDSMHKDSLQEAFKRLQKRIVGIHEITKIAETEKQRAQNMMVECAILKRQIKQKENELAESIQQLNDYKQSVSSIIAHNQLLTCDNSSLLNTNKLLQEAVSKFSNCRTVAQSDFEGLEEHIRELKIELADKNARISSLELHIESCCSSNRSKARDYKNQLYEMKQQMKQMKRELQMREAQLHFVEPFPAKIRCTEAEVQTEKIASPLKTNSLGIIERHKVKELEEKIIQLERDKYILKKLCVKRAETIKTLEAKLET